MNRVERWIVLFVVLCMASSLCTGAASASAAPELGGVYIYMPEVRVELKNADENAALSGQLGNEPLQLQKQETFDPSKHSTKVYLLADTSTSMISNESEMKARMRQIVEHLGPNDSAAVVTFGAQVQTVSDSANPDELLQAIDEIHCVEDDTLLCEAMQQVYMKSLSGYSAFDRQYVVVFSDFSDFQIGSTTYDEVQSSYTSRMLPLYGVFAPSTIQDDADKFGRLCRNSGGGFIPMRTSEEDFNDSLDEIDNVTIAYFTASSNNADGSNKLLTIHSDDKQQNVMVPVVMSREDTEPPQVLSTEYSAKDGVIAIVFSEPVLNADRLDSYELRGPDDVIQHLDRVSYHRETYSAELAFTPQETGDYVLTFYDITDDSAQRNVLKDAIKLSIVVPAQEPSEDESQEEPNTIEKKGLSDWLPFLLLGLLALIAAVIIAAAALSRKRRITQEDDGGIEYDIIENQKKESEIHRHIINEKKARLHLTLKTGRNEILDITQDIVSSLIFGRSGNCDICIDDRKLSRQHFAIECDNGRLFLSDLQSTNGTMLNGIRIGARREIHPRDIIFAGQTEIQIRDIQ